MSYFKRTGTGINDVVWDETELATKAEVDEIDTKVENISGGTTELPYLPKAGGTMTGSIDMGANVIANVGAPTNPTDAATKKYVDDAVTGVTPTESYLPVAGGTMEGNLNMGNHQITNVDTFTATNIIIKGTAEASASIKVTGDASRSEIDLNDASNNPVVLKGVDTPANNNDAANKSYVDAVDAKLTTVNSELTGVKNTVTTLNSTVEGIVSGTGDTPYLKLAGGTMTGALTLSGAPVADNDAVTKKYVDDGVNEASELTLTANESVSLFSYLCIRHHKLIFLNVIFDYVGQLSVGTGLNIDLFKINNVKVKPMRFALLSHGKGVDENDRYVSDTIFELTCGISENGQVTLQDMYAGGSPDIKKEKANTTAVLTQMFSIVSD